ncbi:MAG: bifunctional phosphoglucose/phosphomannose isomerase [Thermoplasmata archaeon]|nr:MAG: bifunctional phosphoglucose/phosphomannose isomerase [Thermoplasmata archaeon]
MPVLLDDLDAIRNHDKGNMLGTIENFPEQLEEAVDIAQSIDVEMFKPRQIVIAGVGGSAIGGDILASWLFKRIDIPIFTNRAYKLPTFVREKTLLFAVSYSGNTEETLSLFTEGLNRGCSIIAITSGGELEKRARRENVTLISIPKGKPPRASVAYLFMPIVAVLKKLCIYNPDNEVEVAIETVRKLREHLVPDILTEKNPAKQLALELLNETPIIYGLAIFNAIARRWQTQLNENAKMLSWHGTFPEMNHNEIEAWGADDTSKRFTAVILRDNFRLDSRLQKRVKLTKETILQKQAKKVIDVVAEGGQEKDYLARMLYSMYLGDFVSVYLAILKGIDPTPVATIEGFKRDLAGFSGL